MLNSFVELFCSFIFICFLVLSMKSPKLKVFDCLLTKLKTKLNFFTSVVTTIFFFLLGYWCLEGCFVNINCYIYRQQKNLYNIEFLESSKRGLMAMSITILEIVVVVVSRYFKSIFFVKDLFREMVVVVRDESGGWLHKQFGEALFSNILILKLPH